MFDITKDFDSKIKLKFNNDGKFKILQISDIQEILDFDQNVTIAVNKLLDVTTPDVVVLGGDMINGLILKKEDELVNYLHILLEPFESRHIPYLHVYGNHDHDMDISCIRESEIYESFPYCISKHTINITGASNFVIPVNRHDNDECVFTIWGLDSNNCYNEWNEIKLPKSYECTHSAPNASGFDIIHTDQIIWYYQASNEIKRYYNKNINGIMFFHIPPHEFQYVLDHKEECKTVGSCEEHMNLGAVNSGIISTILDVGNIKAIGCGHSHEDCFAGKYGDILFCMDGSAGFRCYGNENSRGGRLYTINENNTNDIDTKMILFKDIL